MSDLKKFAEDLILLTNKEALELAKIIKEEFDIKVKNKKKELPFLQIKKCHYLNSKAKKKKTKRYPRRK